MTIPEGNTSELRLSEQIVRLEPVLARLLTPHKHELAPSI